MWPRVKREADQTGSIFADNGHSDWRFLPSPPAATLRYRDTIPPVGGDTLFAHQGQERFVYRHRWPVWAVEKFRNGYPKIDLAESRRSDFLDVAKGSRTLKTRLAVVLAFCRPHS